MIIAFNMCKIYQVVEDISLMQVNGDECLKLSPFDFGEVLRCHIDKSIEHVQEDLISGGHYLLVGACIDKCYFCIPGPNELNPKNTNLQITCKDTGII